MFVQRKKITGWVASASGWKQYHEETFTPDTKAGTVLVDDGRTQRIVGAEVARQRWQLNVADGWRRVK